MEGKDWGAVLVSKGMTNFVQALVAVVAGNAIYFVLTPYLPPSVRHSTFKTDLGTFVDFCLCLGIFVMIKRFASTRDRSDESFH